MSDEEKKFADALKNILQDIPQDEDDDAWEKFSDPLDEDGFDGPEKKQNFLDEQEDPSPDEADMYDEEFIVEDEISIDETAFTEEEDEAEADISAEVSEEEETEDQEEQEAQETQETEERSSAPQRQRNKSARPSSGRYQDSLPSDKKSSKNKAEKKPAAKEQIQKVQVEQESAEDKKPKKKNKFLKCVGLLLTMAIVVAITGYAGASYYYTNRFFDGTVINGMDVSRKTALEVENLLEKKVEGYSIEVLSRNQQPQSIDGSVINYRYMSDGEVLSYLKSQKPYEWVMGFIRPSVYTVKETTAYDKELLKGEIKRLECAKAENQVEPENAYVAYTDNKFEIIPETEGSALNLKQAYQVLEAAVAQSQQSIDFNSEPEVYESAEITSSDANLQATVEACNNFTRASITYLFGDQKEVLDGSVIKDWLVFDDKNQLVQDDSSFSSHIAEYVDQLKTKYDTVGTSREFYTTSGRVVSVYGSAYGWKIDKDAEVAQLAQEIRDGVQIEREPVYSMTANSRGTNDFGNTYIEVDLAYQHMYYYQDGVIIMDSDIVSGNPNYSDRITPPGVFTLYYKKSPDVLRGQQDEEGNYEYETEVTYWMPFNGGIGFHDATWQPDFGGDMYLWNGSHGCINLPYWAAATLYDIIQYNVPIVVFN